MEKEYITTNIKNPFKPFKNIHLNESAILFGSGPTLESFDASSVPSNFIKVGLNEQIFLDLDLDYWFMGDSFPRDKNKFTNFFDDYNNYKPKLAKFIRFQTWGEHGSMPLNMKHSLYYKCDEHKETNSVILPNGATTRLPQKCLFQNDISENNLIAVATISFEALQFILYTGIKNIYLVGHDCDYSYGTFRTKMIDNYDEEYHILSYWNHVNNWLKENMPEVKIYSINPVALNIFEEKNIKMVC